MYEMSIEPCDSASKIIRNNAGKHNATVEPLALNKLLNMTAGDGITEEINWDVIVKDILGTQNDSTQQSDTK